MSPLARDSIARTPLVRGLLVMALLVLAAAVASGAAVWRAHAATPAGAAAAGSRHARCMFIMAGRDATADGSVLMSYNNDWTANNWSYLDVVPGTAKTFGYVRIETQGDYPEGGMNSQQFAACYGVATDLAPAVLAADPYVKKGVGEHMWDLLLARCSSCREALDQLQRWAGTIGFSDWCAGSFGMSDENEAWVFELLGGHHWAAARVPDDMYYAQPNMPRLRTIDLSDRDDYRGSPDLVAFAKRLGRYKPSQGPFDVAWAYGDRKGLLSRDNTDRLWGAAHLLSPSQTFAVGMPYATRPVFGVPDTKLTVSSLIGVNRYHYEGTALDQTAGYTKKSPHKVSNRTICCSYTDYSVVFQSRAWLPDGLGGVLWFAPSRACSSSLTPFYCGITRVPSAWAGKTAFVAFKKVADSLDRPGKVGGELRYKHHIGLVRSTYDGFFAATQAQTADVEDLAASLWPVDRAQAVAALTAFSGERATADYDLARALPGQMP